MKTKIILSSVLLILTFGILTEWMGVTISEDILFTSCQPAEIKYQSSESYCLRVVKLNQWMHSTTLILISKQNVDSSYGYTLNFPTLNIISPEEFDKLKVDWKLEGVMIETFWNEKIFIPAKNITQSR